MEPETELLFDWEHKQVRRAEIYKYFGGILIRMAERNDRIRNGHEYTLDDFMDTIKRMRDQLAQE